MKVGGEHSSSSGGAPGPRLVQEAEFHLYGNVESLDSVALPHSSRSTLVLSFKEAKVSYSSCPAQLTHSLLYVFLGAQCVHVAFFGGV